MEKKDFPKGTTPREIFVYTCERIAEPLIPLGYKYRKSKNDIYKKAETYRNEHITKVDSYEEFKKVLEEKGGFISAHWDGTAEEEEQIKNETKATIRCIPLDAKEEQGISLVSGKPSSKRVLFAKAY